MSKNDDAREFLMGSGVKSAVFPAVGSVVVGHIYQPTELVPQRNFDTGEPLLWEDGKPRQQLKVVVMTDQRDPNDPDDDGLRALYLRGNSQKAVARAVREAGANDLEVGGRLMVKYIADGIPAKKGAKPPKCYEATYRPPEDEPVPEPADSAGIDDGDGTNHWLGLDEAS